MTRAVVALAALVACRHGADAPISNTPVVATPGYHGDDLALIPIDSEVVIGVNWSRAVNSELYSELVAPRLASVDELVELRSACGFDAMTAMTSMVIGMRDLDGNRTSGVGVVHGFDRARLEACVRDRSSVFKKTRPVLDGDVILAADPGGRNGAAMLFVDEHTAVIVFGPDATRAGVHAAATRTDGLRASPAFVELIAKVRTKDVMWGVANGYAKAFSGTGVKLKAIYGSIDITDNLTIDGHLVTSSPGDATSLAGMLKAQAGQLRSFVDRLDIATAGQQVDIGVAMSHAKVISLAGMMLGAVGPQSPPATPVPPSP
jgi:hypothetical protein